MSLALFILLTESEAPELTSWNRAMVSEGVPVIFQSGSKLTRHTGFLPAQLKGRNAGLYFGLESYSELLENYPGLKKTPKDRPVVYSLGYGGHLDECAVVFLSASILVSRFNGIAFDPESGKTLTMEQVKSAANQCLELAQ